MDGKKAKVLLCEDDTNLGSVLKNYLELNDYDVTLERDGRLGLAAFQRESFDLCLLDVMMPNMDGFTLAEEIRDINPDVPLFFLSAKTLALANIGQLEKAALYCRDSLLLEPTNKYTYFTYGLILVELNHLQDAEKALKKSIGIRSLRNFTG